MTKYYFTVKVRDGWTFLGTQFGHEYWKHDKCGNPIPEWRLFQYGFTCPCEVCR